MIVGLFVMHATSSVIFSVPMLVMKQWKTTLNIEGMQRQSADC